MVADSQTHLENPLSQGYLFDTNIVIAAFEKEETVTRRLEELPVEKIFVSVANFALIPGTHRVHRVCRDQKRAHTLTLCV